MDMLPVPGVDAVLGTTDAGVTAVVGATGAGEDSALRRVFFTPQGLQKN